MLKPRNILIIIILTFVVTTVIGFAFESELVASSARTATAYTQIAAHCAVKSVTMSDEFFTSGVSSTGNYQTYSDKLSHLSGVKVNLASGASSGILIDMDNNNNFTNGNIFLTAYNYQSGFNSLPEQFRGNQYRYFTESLFTKMYDRNPNFLSWARGYFSKAYNSTSSKSDYATRSLVYTTAGDGVTHTFKIPKLLSMGARLFVDGNRVFTSKSLISLLNKNKDTTATFVWNDVKNILASADYWNYKRTTSLTNGATDYYYTPISLGLTYIDPNVLNILFRNNMDLLMRAKYINNANGNLNGYSEVIETPYYFDADSYPSDWGTYAVNNGEFYYLRGKLSGAARMGTAKTYSIGSTTCKAPKIEYLYYPITPETKSKSPSAIIQRAVSPITTSYSLLNNSSSNEVNYKSQKCYDLIIAKITFYADFAYPYKTSALSGMAEHFGISGESWESDQHLMGITIDNTGTKDSALNGATQYKYTMYYAVAN